MAPSYLSPGAFAFVVSQTLDVRVHSYPASDCVPGIRTPLKASPATDAEACR